MFRLILTIWARTLAEGHRQKMDRHSVYRHAGVDCSGFIPGSISFAHDRRRAMQLTGCQKTPPGAIVHLDGSQVGVTPVRLSDIPTRYHDIRAACPGHKNRMARVEILPSSGQRLLLEMVPMKPPGKDLYMAANTPPGVLTGGTYHNPKKL
jgi:hypothetical protein